MKFVELNKEAILWTCYLENFKDSESYLKIFNLSKADRLMFDCLGRFFPFDDFYVRDAKNVSSGMITDLGFSEKSLILPWMYRPTSPENMIDGKNLSCPSRELFNFLDNKIESKKLLKKLGLPSPKWGFKNKGVKMLEKPIETSYGGQGIGFTTSNPREGHFLEEYLFGYRSIGLQFFIYDETEFLCADEMLYKTTDKNMFNFYAQRNVQRSELPKDLLRGCFYLADFLLKMRYRGLVGIDAMVKDQDYNILEVNPRGIAFLPAFFAASNHGWKNFETYMKEGKIEDEEIVLLDFGKSKKIVSKI